MRALSILIFAVTLSACSHITVQRDDTSGAKQSVATKTYRIHSFLWAFVPGRQLPPQHELCPHSRIESLDLRMSGGDVLIASATLGLYVPHRVTVACSNFAGSLP